MRAPPAPATIGLAGLASPASDETSEREDWIEVSIGSPLAAISVWAPPRAAK